MRRRKRSGEIDAYRRPYATYAARASAAVAGGGVAVRGVEVVQAVQALDNSVTLIAGKPALARVYLDAPSAVHFDFMRSFLVRAFPVATIEWSQIVIDADFAPPFTAETPVLANAQIAAIRSREVSNGIDARTHYYGLVDDAGGKHFMRGRAYTIPHTPRPDVVASGPVGVPAGFSGDRDESYADWYGAHELAHTFGRYHPGFPPFDPHTGAGQDASDPMFPYPEGRISTSDGRYVGLDLGDPGLNFVTRVLAGTTHHDVMTYRDHQWLSAYTYEAILARLVAEEALIPGS